MIEFKHVTKTYRSATRDTTVTALNDINLTIEDGEVVFLVGSNGAGKTTLMRLLTRMEVPTSGSLVVNGYDLRKIRKRKIPEYRSQIGMDFQDFKLFSKYTVYENVAFAMRVLGKSSRSIKKTVPLVLSMLDISARANHFPLEISGGEQQRTALARALVNNPKILIADEPTANLSPTMSREVMDLLVTLGENGKRTVLIITHDIKLISNYENIRIVKFERGKIVYDSKFEEAFVNA
ncbi:MAG: ATP-binding cassette domain-containing protein [Clostridia bacterium]|nr:ATP-binding cassette domain-containing protein [Clostridia bacterium]